MKTLFWIMLYIILTLEILFGKEIFDKGDMKIADEFYNYPGMAYIAGLTEYGLELRHNMPKIEILYFFGINM